MKVAYVFPAQGSQRVGMGRDLYDNFASARAAFDQADEALGFPLSRLCFEGPEAELLQTINAQPALVMMGYHRRLLLPVIVWVSIQQWR